MNKIENLISRYIQDDITADEHRELASALENSPENRKTFRELIDLQIGLTAWSNEVTQAELDDSGLARQTIAASPNRPRAIPILGIAAALLLAATAAWSVYQSKNNATNSRSTPLQIVNAEEGLGTICTSNCTWTASPQKTSNGKFSTGSIQLASGLAQLRFDSGTKLTLSGPCELIVESISSAKLIAGDAVVHVAEISDGFLLTTPDAKIIDQGTEYGVSIDDHQTEIHVFDGKVIWQPLDDDADQSETISAGQASQISRSDPRSSKRIPFGKRQFVRNMEAIIQQQAEGKLIAFDGFENLAGKIRRDRSGFGWQGGWHPPGRRRKSGTIVDTPNDQVFGISRDGQRQLELGDGVVILRDLESQIVAAPQSQIFVSMLLEPSTESPKKEAWFQFLLSCKATGRQSRRTPNGIGFGIASDLSPYVKNGGAISDLALRLSQGVLFCVAKISFDEQTNAQISLRIYQPGDTIEQTEPVDWAVASQIKRLTSPINKVSLSTGKNGSWKIDQLRIGKSWSSVMTLD